MKSIAKGIIVILAVMLFLGSMAIGVSPDQSVKAKFTGTVSTINQNFNERLPYETIWADPIMNSPHKSAFPAPGISSRRPEQ